MAAGRVSAELYTGTWTDVGTPERLHELNAGAPRSIRLKCCSGRCHGHHGAQPSSYKGDPKAAQCLPWTPPPTSICTLNVVPAWPPNWVPAASPSCQRRPSDRATATASSCFALTATFYYLTGFTEPNAWLVITADGETTLFCQPKDLEREIWDGIRMGPEAAPSHLGMSQAFSVAELDQRLPRLLENRHTVWYPFATHKGLEGRMDGWLQAYAPACATARCAPTCSATCAACSTKCG
jgi:hypothetical protein